MPQNEIKISISGSKSLTNRYLVLKEVFECNLELINTSNSEDSELLKEAFSIIKNNTGAIINVNHAGTVMRFLTAYLSTKEGVWILNGSARMQERPIAPLVETLKQLGAEIFSLGEEGYPPLKIVGKNLHGGQVEIDSSISSQFISALLLAAPLFKNGLELFWKTPSVSKPYIAMTIELLKQFGVETEYQAMSAKVKPIITLKPKIAQVFVESDWSSASYWYNFLLISKNKTFRLSTFVNHSVQADCKVAELYTPLGIKTTFFENYILLERVDCNLPKKLEIDFSDCPDIAQTIAVASILLKIPAFFTGLQTLKIKETDRIAALQKELQKLKAPSIATKSTLEIYPTLNMMELQSLNCVISTYNDHRMAMAFAPLLLLSKGITIENKSVVSKSYPNFWVDVEKLIQ